MTTYAKTVVTPDQVNFYNENGYILFEKLIDEETLAALRVETDRIVAEAALITEHNAQYDLEDSHTASDPRVRRLKSPSVNWPFFWDLVKYQPVLDVVEALIGTDIRLQNDKLNMKSAQFGAAVEWHQDWPFYPHTNDDLLSAGILLDDCHEENGPLLVIPGSHKRPIYDHHEDGFFSGAVDPDNFDWDMGADPVALEGPAGSVSFHHVRIMHGSALNTSDRMRRLLLNGYAAADAWPIMGLGKMSLDDYNARICHGNQVLQPRQTEVPPYLPLPAAPLQGSIYENQKALKNRFFDTYKKS
jgi:ectoine hydroxylase-related dioxygenase (phytanoyl-CoA dioxygenase family)